MAFPAVNKAAPAIAATGRVRYGIRIAVLIVFSCDCRASRRHVDLPQSTRRRRNQYQTNSAKIRRASIRKMDTLT